MYTCHLALQRLREGLHGLDAILSYLPYQARQQKQNKIELTLLNGGDGSAAKSVCCSCTQIRGLTTVTLVPGDPAPSFASYGF